MKGRVFLFSAALASATPVAAQTYACAAWSGDTNGMQPISEIVVSDRMMTLKQDSLRLTARMVQGSLRRRVFVDEDSVLIVHGKPVLSGGAPPKFGDRVTLHRLHLDETAPVLAQTACTRLK